MDEQEALKDIEKGIFSQKKGSKIDIPWKNLSIGIGVVVIVSVGIYFMVSSSIKASDYKSMDLSTGKQEESVAGASVQGPFGPPQNVTPTKAPVTPTSTPEPTTAPTATPTNKPDPTNTPTPTHTPTPTYTPTPTPTETPTPTPDPTPTDDPEDD